jgi:phosphoglycerate dehydrogenase-like enzyme
MLAKLPRRCVVVNVGRGNAVDEHALYRALKSRRLAGAYLDVRKHEPSASVLESPGYVKALADLPNCVVMPHAAAFSPRYLERCIMELKDEGLV